MDTTRLKKICVYLYKKIRNNQEIMEDIIWAFLDEIEHAIGNTQDEDTIKLINDLLLACMRKEEYSYQDEKKRAVEIGKIEAATHLFQQLNSESKKEQYNDLKLLILRKIISTPGIDETDLITQLEHSENQQKILVALSELKSDGDVLTQYINESNTLYVSTSAEQRILEEDNEQDANSLFITDEKNIISFPEIYSTKTKLNVCSRGKKKYYQANLYDYNDINGEIKNDYFDYIREM